MSTMQMSNLEIFVEKLKIFFFKPAKNPVFPFVFFCSWSHFEIDFSGGGKKSRLLINVGRVRELCAIRGPDKGQGPGE